ncbi:MAG TPA: tRNA pseudouridine(38-40) synthase TruA [Chthoniobacterales bacterium]
MPHRLKFIVAYDGTPFAGWQSQAGGNTIQDLLEKAFVRVAGEAIRVHGSGRTDAGVHALAQCAHVDVPTRKLPPESWTGALNDSLPSAIRVVRCRYVRGDFHARFNAKGKLYRYRIWNERFLSPFEIDRAWHVPAQLDFAGMQSSVAQFIGRHDFASFTANRGHPNESTIRTIHIARAQRRGSCITLEFAGDGFLYKMVRLIAGALVRGARDGATKNEIVQRLENPHAKLHARPSAPAAGLYLVRVFY